MSVSSEAPLVTLLRSSDGPENRYVRAMEAAGFRAICQPVLRFSVAGDEDFSDEDLRERLGHPGRYAGLIVTSPRAVRALGEILPWLPGQVVGWEAKPAYVVGPKTGAAMRELGFEPTGEESGSASALAAAIAKQKEKERPLLFLCGNRRRDELPRRLKAEGVPVEECEVYRTHLRSNLAFEERPTWVVFFSPSGVEAVRQTAGLNADAFRKAAIGPTTAEAVREAGWTPEAVAATPTPDRLARALREAGT